MNEGLISAGGTVVEGTAGKNLNKINYRIKCFNLK